MTVGIVISHVRNGSKRRDSYEDAALSQSAEFFTARLRVVSSVVRCGLAHCSARTISFKFELASQPESNSAT